MSPPLSFSEVKVTRVPFSQSLVNAVPSPGGRSKRLKSALEHARLSSLGAKVPERDTSHAATAERRGQAEKTIPDERNARGGDSCLACRERSNTPSPDPENHFPEQGDSDDAGDASEPPHTWAWMFEYRFIRYILEAPGGGGHNALGPLPASSTFKPLTFNVCFPPDQLRRQFLNSPPTRALVRLRQGLFGSSSIRVEVPSLAALILRDVVHPFYVFQLLAVALWFFDDYVQYAVAILLITSVSTGAECMRTRHNLLRLRDLAAQRCSVVAYRVTGENEGILGGELCDEIVSGGSATQTEEGEQQPGPLRCPEHAPASSAGASQEERPAAGREKERKGTRDGDGEEKRNTQVVREGVDSADLVVGDIFEVTMGTVLPCDAIVLRGTIVVTESCLTGESFPIIKTPLPEGRTDGGGDAERGLNLEQAAKHQLFAGTKVLSVRVPAASSPSSAFASPCSSVVPPADVPRALAAVCRVGYATAQGRTFRRLLFKSAVRIDFERDALKFVAILAVLAVIGGIFTLVISILHSLPTAEIVFRMFDLFTAAVPPALPASMSVGLSVAVTRLYSLYRVYCTAPARLSLGGFVRCLCFDKTGTLTEEGVGMAAFLPACQCASSCSLSPETEARRAHAVSDSGERQRPSFLSLVSPQALRSSGSAPNTGDTDAQARHSGGVSTRDRDFPPSTACACIKYSTQCMSACHSLLRIGGEVAGDPLELQMLANTKWLLLDGQGSEPPERPHEKEQERGRESMEATGGGSRGGMFGEGLRKLGKELDAVSILSRPESRGEERPREKELLLWGGEDRSARGAKEAGENGNFFSERKHSVIAGVPEEEHAAFQQLQRELQGGGDIPGLTFMLPPDPFVENKRSLRGALAIVRRFDFDASLQRMSVVAVDTDSRSYFVYCKGSTEVLRTLCDRRTLPADLEERLHRFSASGYRVIALAGRRLSLPSEQSSSPSSSSSSSSSSSLAWFARHVSREAAERNLTFLGLALFTNKLKEETTAVISTLRRAQCTVRIATGDHALTSIAVARECGLLGVSAPPEKSRRRRRATRAAAPLEAAREKGEPLKSVEAREPRGEGFSLFCGRGRATERAQETKGERGARNRTSCASTETRGTQEATGANLSEKNWTTLGSPSPPCCAQPRLLWNWLRGHRRQRRDIFPAELGTRLLEPVQEEETVASCREEEGEDAEDRGEQGYDFTTGEREREKESGEGAAFLSAAKDAVRALLCREEAPTKGSTERNRRLHLGASEVESGGSFSSRRLHNEANRRREEASADEEERREDGEIVRGPDDSEEEEASVVILGDVCRTEEDENHVGGPEYLVWTLLPEAHASRASVETVPSCRERGEGGCRLVSPASVASCSRSRQRASPQSSVDLRELLATLSDIRAASLVVTGRAFRHLKRLQTLTHFPYVEDCDQVIERVRRHQQEMLMTHDREEDGARDVREEEEEGRGEDQKGAAGTEEGDAAVLFASQRRRGEARRTHPAGSQRDRGRPGEHRPPDPGTPLYRQRDREKEWGPKKRRGERGEGRGEREGREDDVVIDVNDTSSERGETRATLGACPLLAVPPLSHRRSAWDRLPREDDRGDNECTRFPSPLSLSPSSRSAFLSPGFHSRFPASGLPSRGRPSSSPCPLVDLIDQQGKSLRVPQPLRRLGGLRGREEDGEQADIETGAEESLWEEDEDVCFSIQGTGRHPPSRESLGASEETSRAVSRLDSFAGQLSRLSSPLFAAGADADCPLLALPPTPQVSPLLDARRGPTDRHRGGGRPRAETSSPRREGLGNGLPRDAANGDNRRQLPAFSGIDVFLETSEGLASCVADAESWTHSAWDRARREREPGRARRPPHFFVSSSESESGEEGTFGVVRRGDQRRAEARDSRFFSFLKWPFFRRKGTSIQRCDAEFAWSLDRAPPTPRWRRRESWGQRPGLGGDGGGEQARTLLVERRTTARRELGKRGQADRGVAAGKRHPVREGGGLSAASFVGGGDGQQSDGEEARNEQIRRDEQQLRTVVEALMFPGVAVSLLRQRQKRDTRRPPRARGWGPASLSAGGERGGPCSIGGDPKGETEREKLRRALKRGRRAGETKERRSKIRSASERREPETGTSEKGGDGAEATRREDARLTRDGSERKGEASCDEHTSFFSLSPSSTAHSPAGAASPLPPLASGGRSAEEGTRDARNKEKETEEPAQEEAEREDQEQERQEDGEESVAPATRLASLPRNYLPGSEALVCFVQQELQKHQSFHHVFSPGEYFPIKEQSDLPPLSRVDCFPSVFQLAEQERGEQAFSLAPLLPPDEKESVLGDALFDLLGPSPAPKAEEHEEAAVVATASALLNLPGPLDCPPTPVRESTCDLAPFDSDTLASELSETERQRQETDPSLFHTDAASFVRPARRKAGKEHEREEREETAERGETGGYAGDQRKRGGRTACVAEEEKRADLGVRGDDRRRGGEVGEEGHAGLRRGPEETRGEASTFASGEAGLKGPKRGKDAGEKEEETGTRSDVPRQTPRACPCGALHSTQEENEISTEVSWNLRAADEDLHALRQPGGDSEEDRSGGCSSADEGESTQRRGPAKRGPADKTEEEDPEEEICRRGEEARATCVNKLEEVRLSASRPGPPVNVWEGLTLQLRVFQSPQPRASFYRRWRLGRHSSEETGPFSGAGAPTSHLRSVSSGALSPLDAEPSQRSRRSSEARADAPAGEAGVAVSACREQGEETPATQEGHAFFFHMSLYEYVVRQTVVLCRASPQDKGEFVSALQELPSDPVVAMCGDGTNDAVAIKQADVGISIISPIVGEDAALAAKPAEAERGPLGRPSGASLASAFSAVSLWATVQLLREGRCMIMNSFSTFKFIACYSVLQLTSVLLLYAQAGNLTDSQYMWIDLITILPLSIAVARTNAADVLSHLTPPRSLVSAPVLVSLLGQITLHVFFQIFVLFHLRQQPFFVPFVPPDAGDRKDSLSGMENTVVFLISSMQYVFCCAAFTSSGFPWRKAIWTNHLCFLGMALLVILPSLLLLFTPADIPSPSSHCFGFLAAWLNLRVASIPHFFRLQLLQLAACNGVLALLFEMVIVKRLLERHVEESTLKCSRINSAHIPADRRRYTVTVVYP
ncbi:UNVERIFIED_CONTAM: cation-transporting ATPase, putative [Hammondia hammondi]|eukprot:XP_008889406.1 cation-transporting ATPase, putative [Hammondia hammondi]